MKIIIAVLLSFVLTACSVTDTDKPQLQKYSPYKAADAPSVNVPKDINEETKYQPLNYDTVKAVWISYIELAGISGSGKEHFKKCFSEMCDNCSDMGINTLFVHVRTFGDSFYSSKLYPYTKAFNGKPFDALKIMLEEAHSRKLSFHAWINPLRCETADVLDNTSDKYLIKQWYDDPVKYDEYVVYVQSTGHYWLNPAVDAVRELIAEGAEEIVRDYEVDGVHIDDYFYPTDQPFFDSGIYVEQGIETPLNEWRLDNCSKMVSQIYDAVKKHNSAVEFGIAPQGNIENNYNYMFADVKRWCSEDGFCDYICPQIYFGFENKMKPYAPTLDEWVDMCSKSGRKLLIGIGAYKINTEDEFTDDVGIIKKQAKLAIDKTDGAALFSYNSFFKTERGEQERAVVSELLNGVENKRNN